MKDRKEKKMYDKMSFDFEQKVMDAMIELQIDLAAEHGVNIWHVRMFCVQVLARTWITGYPDIFEKIVDIFRTSGLTCSEERQASAEEVKNLDDVYNHIHKESSQVNILKALADIISKKCQEVSDSVGLAEQLHSPAVFVKYLGEKIKEHDTTLSNLFAVNHAQMKDCGFIAVTAESVGINTLVRFRGALESSVFLDRHNQAVTWKDKNFVACPIDEYGLNSIIVKQTAQRLRYAGEPLQKVFDGPVFDITSNIKNATPVYDPEGMALIINLKDLELTT